MGFPGIRRKAELPVAAPLQAGAVTAFRAVVPGELAVVIAASTPHRAEAFAACRHAIERLKADVPIWKKEVYADGAVWVGLGP